MGFPSFPLIGIAFFVLSPSTFADDYHYMKMARSFFNDGSFSGILIRIVNVTRGLKIKADSLILEDLIINDSSKESTNKAIYYPKTSNLFFKDTVIYYLLTHGTITNDNTSNLRYPKVISKVETYSDNDYLDLETKVRSVLSVDKTDHQISFMIQNKIDPYTWGQKTMYRERSYSTVLKELGGSI